MRAATDRLLTSLGEPLAVFAVALLVRLDHLGATALNADELLHLYAARSLLSDGTLAIFGGFYRRASQFTDLVAGAMLWLGDVPASVRLPSALAGAALVALTYAWLRREAGRGPGLVAALILGLMAPAVEVSQFGRPYAVQAVLFWLAAMLLYRIVVGGVSWLGVVLFGILSAALMIEAAAFQIVSLIGVAGLAVWASVYLTWRLRSSVPRQFLVLVWAVGALACGLLMQSGAAQGFIESYRSTVFWASASRSDATFYLSLMDKPYGFFLNFLPLAVLAAVITRPTPGMFCSAVWLVGFVLHSFGGMKAERYLAYLLPFFACIWALALWAFLQGLRGVALARLQAFAPKRAAAIMATAAVFSISLLAVVKAAPILSQELRELLLPGYQRPRNDERERLWRASAPILRPLAVKADVFVVDDDLLADYYVARPDVVLNTSRLLENDPPIQFVRDYRTGVPTISSDAALRDLLACFKTGLIVEVTFVYDWLSPAAKTLLTEHTTPLGLGPGLQAFTWDRRYGEPSTDCAILKQSIAASQAQRRALLKR